MLVDVVGMRMRGLRIEGDESCKDHNDCEDDEEVLEVVVEGSDDDLSLLVKPLRRSDPILLLLPVFGHQFVVYAHWVYCRDAVGLLYGASHCPLCVLYPLFDVPADLDL